MFALCDVLDKRPFSAYTGSISMASCAINTSNNTRSFLSLLHSI